eukprot:CAMPEP_0115153902 /NCGR_PEP_ID=MMETSP0227-20121206/66987_1 /TAXON_ID=89957 /ORGANISM="Polarella glacialis, Strain CCMP 1383" /LENGTH=46 /DNA_ID= /DNA_START= /DNA_END= /DNA_ORIENTATION=
MCRFGPRLRSQQVAGAPSQKVHLPQARILAQVLAQSAGEAEVKWSE